MMRTGLLGGLAGACLAACGAAGGAPDADPMAGLVDDARAFVELLVKEDYDGAVARFDATMRQAMPAPALKAAWQGLLAKTGAFREQTGVRTQGAGAFRIVLVTCAFERTPLDVKVVYDGKGQVTGLWFVPSAPPAEWTPPAYADADRFEERGVTVGRGEWTLPGTLAVPKGDGPVPAVVLVHGSGPQDRDETIGPNKPFRDLAWGLASRGVAVLRYEKRTKAHPQKCAALADTFTVKEETVDDALAAVALLEGTKGIDAARIFILGHSLGATLVPRMEAGEPRVAGYILLAGSARPIENVLLEQTEYVLSADGALSAEEQADLEALKVKVARVKDPALSPKTPAADLPMGVPAAYWLDLRSYDAAEAAKGVRRPMLILQGGRDYQVTDRDFQRWRAALAGRSDVTFKRYADLNHLFVPGSGKGTPAEYNQAGHVAEAVIVDVAAWIARPAP